MGDLHVGALEHESQQNLNEIPAHKLKEYANRK